MKLQGIKHKGFTLIELMIAVAIVGILAAVALPAYLDYAIRGQTSEAFEMLGGVQTAITEQIAVTGDIAGTMADGGTGIRGVNFPIDGKYIRYWTTQGGNLEVIFWNQASSKLANKVLYLHPNFDSENNLTYWTCIPNNVPKNWLPSSCN